MDAGEISRSWQSKVHLVTGGAGMLGRAMSLNSGEGQERPHIDIEPAKNDRPRS